MDTTPRPVTTDARAVVITPGVWIVALGEDPATLEHAQGVIQTIGHLFEVTCRRFPLERTYCPTLEDAVALIVARAG